MRKSLIGALLTVSLMIIFPFVALADTTSTVPVQRIYGQDRYQTATAVADQLLNAWDVSQFNSVVLASGNNWPDAICASPFAELVEGPILLLDTKPTSAGSQTTWDYINSHVSKTGKVYIIGGTGVIPQSFTDKLVSMGFSKDNIEQIGGKDRDETSYLLYKEYFKYEYGDQGAILVTDKTFYDALTVSGYASFFKNPVLLVPPKGITDSAESQLVNSSSFNAWPIGDIVASVNNICPKANIHKPISGGGEYATNRNFIENDGMEAPTIFLATGDNYPDALAGAVLAGAGKQQPTQFNGYIPLPMQFVLTKTNSLDISTQAILNEITFENKSLGITPDPNSPDGWRHLPAVYPNQQLVVFGGPGAITDSVLNQVIEVMSGPGNHNP